MAYTMERLEQALNLFRRTKPHLKREGFPHKYLEKNIQSKYELRWRTLNKAKDLCSTWIDNDNSADYDPKQRTPKRKRILHPNEGHEIERATKKSRVQSLQDDDLLVTLKLKSDAGRIFLSTLPDRSVNYDDADISGETGFPVLFSSHRYSLRARGKTNNFKYPWSDKRPSRGGSPSSTQSLLSLDLSHPAARGCRSCWEFNHECSLLDKPLVYPCQVCREDREDCELIIQPKRKRGCENCRNKKKVVCSYLQDDDHHLPCKQCQAVGLRCLAGPAKDKQDQTADHTPDSSPSESLSTQRSSPPRPQNSAEAVQPLPAPRGVDPHGFRSSSPYNEIKVVGSNRLEDKRELLQDTGSKPREPEPPFAEKGKNVYCRVQSRKNELVSTTRIISTSFAHPINFAYEPPNDGSKPCHWCHDFTYGILGLGKVHVEVIDYCDGNGYIEIEGGHVGSGHEPSRMCITCALERIHIMTCSGHKISPLEGYDEENFDYESAYESLSQPMKHGSSTNLWCMLCPSPAFYGCVTVQSFDKFQEPVDPSSPSALGCGLLLCPSCAKLMRRYNSDISKVMSVNKEKDGEDVMRADAIYLLPGNDLYRFYSSEDLHARGGSERDIIDLR